MKIHILNNYTKQIDATFEGHFDVQLLKEYLEAEILFYRETDEIDEYVIKDEIIDFLKQEDCEISPFNVDDEPTDYSLENKDGLEVLNIEELVEYFSYLKRLPTKRNCCVEYNTPFCPICGTKLNN